MMERFAGGALRRLLQEARGEGRRSPGFHGAIALFAAEPGVPARAVRGRARAAARAPRRHLPGHPRGLRQCARARGRIGWNAARRGRSEARALARRARAAAPVPALPRGPVCLGMGLALPPPGRPRRRPRSGGRRGGGRRLTTCRRRRPRPAANIARLASRTRRLPFRRGDGVGQGGRRRPRLPRARGRDGRHRAPRPGARGRGHRSRRRRGRSASVRCRRRRARRRRGRSADRCGLRRQRRRSGEPCAGALLRRADEARHRRGKAGGSTRFPSIRSRPDATGPPRSGRCSATRASRTCRSPTSAPPSISRRQSSSSTTAARCSTPCARARRLPGSCRRSGTTGTSSWTAA